eukprot:Selendium_serpulae@DN5856_c0_g1_i11.p2
MKLSAIENDFGNALDDIDITEDHVSRGQVQKEPDEEVTLIDGDGALESLLEGVGGVKEDLRTDEEQRGDEEEERGKDMSDLGDAEKRLDDRADVRDEEDKSEMPGDKSEMPGDKSEMPGAAEADGKGSEEVESADPKEEAKKAAKRAKKLEKLKDEALALGISPEELLERKEEERRKKLAEQASKD